MPFREQNLLSRAPFSLYADMVTTRDKLDEYRYQNRGALGPKTITGPFSLVASRTD